MFNLMRFKYWFFVVSLLVILPGIFSLAKWGLRLSVDFTGGTIIEIQNSKFKIQNYGSKLKSIFEEQGVELASVQRSGENAYLLRSKAMDVSQKGKLVEKITAEFGETRELRFETVGPVIGKELTVKSLQAVVLAGVAIIIYIAYAFREIPAPYSSWKFGVAAVIALLHDVLVVAGIFSILGYLYHVEIDVLFITALLTVMGFSVHDTIVVFDRIRENLNKIAGKKSFEEVVNESLIQTLGRSLSTSFTVVLTLAALLAFGGESIRWFVVALLVGIISGTYSSIFNAAPLLVIWESRNFRK